MAKIGNLSLQYKSGKIIRIITVYLVVRAKLLSISPTMTYSVYNIWLHITALILHTYKKTLNSVLHWKSRHVPYLGYKHRTDNHFLCFTQEIQTCTIPGDQTQNRLLLTYVFQGKYRPVPYLGYRHRTDNLFLCFT